MRLKILGLMALAAFVVAMGINGLSRESARADAVPVPVATNANNVISVSGFFNEDDNCTNASCLASVSVTPASAVSVGLALVRCDIDLNGNGSVADDPPSLPATPNLGSCNVASAQIDTDPSPAIYAAGAVSTLDGNLSDTVNNLWRLNLSFTCSTPVSTVLTITYQQDQSSSSTTVTCNATTGGGGPSAVNVIIPAVTCGVPATVTAVVIDSRGPQTGTLVTFTTSAGSIPPSASTVNGVATATLIIPLGFPGPVTVTAATGGVSGSALVTCTGGGGGGCGIYVPCEPVSLGCPSVARVGEIVTCRPPTSPVSWSAPGGIPSASIPDVFRTVYRSTGTKTISLRVCNNFGCSTVSQSILIKPR